MTAKQSKVAPTRSLPNARLVVPPTASPDDPTKSPGTMPINDPSKVAFDDKQSEFPLPNARSVVPPTASPDDPTKSPGTMITSDKLEINLAESQSEFLFTGNVKLSTILFSATCAAAKVVTSGKPVNLTSDFDSVKQISITGPLLFQQGERSCSADHAEIITADTTIILSGNATAKDPMGTISGDEIRINYTTKSIEISSTPNNKPVALNISVPADNPKT
ncbi:MAG: LptA/OstA family protein [Puniceicoccales bacterium]|nr:LptA/OstA family protein [Puniceicoccales bacterium]